VTLVTRLVDPESTADDEERYTPQPPRQRRFGRPLIGLLVLVIVALAGLGTAYAWTRTQYFVGADRDKVAIFQGLSEGIPGLSLSRVYEVQQLTIRELPPFYQELSDDEVASVVTYIRKSWGNEAPPVSPAEVVKARGVPTD